GNRRVKVLAAWIIPHSRIRSLPSESSCDSPLELISGRLASAGDLSRLCRSAPGGVYRHEFLRYRQPGATTLRRYRQLYLSVPPPRHEGALLERGSEQH